MFKMLCLELPANCLWDVVCQLYVLHIKTGPDIIFNYSLSPRQSKLNFFRSQNVKLLIKHDNQPYLGWDNTVWNKYQSKVSSICTLLELSRINSHHTCISLKDFLTSLLPSICWNVYECLS